MKTSLPLIKSQENSCRQFLLTAINQKIPEVDEVITKCLASMQAPFEFSNQQNEQVTNIYNVKFQARRLKNMTYKPITLTDQFNILHHFTDCQFIPVDS